MKINRKNNYYSYAYVGKGIDFAAAEAYKLLRTNLLFSLSNTEGCKTVGVTSSVRGEGKSTTAAYLAYSLAEDGKKVLLLEMDMRLPTVAKRFSLESSPGFSNFLVGAVPFEKAVLSSKIHDNLFVMTAGDIPPNPSELLSSDTVENMIKSIKKDFDYIIADLPPVNAVSDALSVAKLIDGFILVVRENFSRKRELNESLRRLKMVEASILGFVVNDDSKEIRTVSQSHSYDYNYSYIASSKTK